MFSGKTDIVAGFLFLALFMIYGLVLIFLREFSIALIMGLSVLAVWRLEKPQ